MEKEVILERKMKLQQGLDGLTQKSVELLKMIEIQKGAIGECDWWLKELESKENPETTEESTMQVVEDEK
jgi:hypothetical protein